MRSCEKVKSIRYSRTNGVDTLKLHHDTLLKTLKKTLVSTKNSCTLVCWIVSRKYMSPHVGLCSHQRLQPDCKIACDVFMRWYICNENCTLCFLFDFVSSRFV